MHRRECRRRRWTCDDGKNHGGCGRRGGRDDGDRRDRHAPSAGAGSGTAGARGGGSGPPPADNANTMRPLSANEIPPNLSFYAIDPLYTPGVPLGWATTRIEETLDRGLDAQPVGERGVYLSWRLLKSDAATVAFDVFRQADGGAPVKITARPVSATTDYTDAAAPRDQALTYWVLPAVAAAGGDARQGERAGRRDGTPVPRDPAPRRREERRPRRHRRPERRRRLRLRGQAPGRQHRSRPRPAEHRHLQARRLRRPHRPLPVARRSRLEHQPRHLVLADGGAGSRRRRQGGSRGARRALRGDAGRGVRRRQGLRPRRARVAGGLRRHHRQGDRQRAVDRARQDDRVGRLQRQPIEPAHARRRAISTARRRAWSSSAAPTA